MVCIPCFIIPLLLYIWHKFVQPIMLRYWNPWQKKDAQGNVIKAGPDFPFECKGGVCPFVPGKDKQLEQAATATSELEADETAKLNANTADGGKEIPVATAETKKEN